MGVPGVVDSARSARMLELLRARLNGQRIDGKEAGFVCNSYVSYDTEELPQAVEWMNFAEKFDNVSADSNLQLLNTFLSSRSVFVGNGTRITLADLGMFVSIRDSVASIPVAEQEKLPNVLRWFDYVQNKEDVREVYGTIYIKKSNFNPPNLNVLDPNKPAKAAVDAKNTVGTDNIKEIPSQPSPAPAVADGVASGNNSADKPSKEKTKETKEKPTKETKEKPTKETQEKPAATKKEVDCDVSVLDICVGQIKKVWKHPSADTLYVEEIDVGEAQPRQIVSGLVKYVPESEMLDRRVLVLLNVKPGKVRDILSSGLVLCASNGDHSQCNPVSPPDGVPVGERVKFAGHDGKPEDVLNPKKKQWEKIAPELRTDEQGVANYQGVPFQTSQGVCRATIVNGSIK